MDKMTHAARLPDHPAVELLNPPDLYDPSANGYSHVARLAPGAQLVYTAGQGGEDSQGQLSPDFSHQVQQAFVNLRATLACAGAALTDVAKLTVLIVDHSEARLAVLAHEIAQAWGTAAKPACTLIPVPRLALDGMLFEVEAIAALKCRAIGENGTRAPDAMS
ncbi:RidA family protein [Paraherbaspirillum soli]|uniref:RidA family protein n=1 Tax=Paraherbaspirillum soli TaxID=631222 RepID=A0ABW0M798_9BURK